MLEALTTLGVAVLSAVVPVVNLEVYLGLLAPRLHGTAAVLVCSAMTGTGSAIGKLVWYVLAARSMEGRWVRKKLGKESWQRRFDRWQGALDGRPWLSAAVLLAASVAGFPPLLVMALVAGALRVPLWVFLPTVTVGRAARAWLILAGVGLALSR